VGGSASRDSALDLLWKLEGDHFVGWLVGAQSVLLEHIRRGGSAGDDIDFGS